MKEVYSIIQQVQEIQVKCENRRLWFRGHNDSAYKLNSGLRRITNKKEELMIWENQLYNAFINYGDFYCKEFLEYKAWNTLFLMQHYGLYTRLLDWTDSLMTALYFATYEKKDKDACVWILDPIAMNRKCVGLYAEENIQNMNINILTLDTLPKNILDPTAFYNNERLEIGSFALIPRRNNDRLVSQNGSFIVQGTRECELEEEYKGYVNEILFKIDIPKEVVEKVRRYTLLNGINYYALYGGIDGLCKYLKEEMLDIKLQNI